MANAKLNTKILGVFFIGETPMTLSLGGFIGENLAPLPMIPPFRRAYNQTRGLIISSLAFATGVSFCILFEQDSQVVLLKTSHYLAIDVRFFQNVWLLLQYIFHVYI